MTKEELQNIADTYGLYTEEDVENRISCELLVVGARNEELEEENGNLKAYNEKLLNGDIEKYNKIVELEQEIAKRAEQIETLNKDKDYFSDALDKQIEATYKVVEKLNEAKELVKALLDVFVYDLADDEIDSGMVVYIERAEKFLEEE